MSFAYTRRYTGRLRAVIFDWAGTTVDFGCQSPIIAFVTAFERLGVPITMAQARGPMGLAKWNHAKAILNEPAVAAAWRARTGREPTNADVDTIYQTFLPLQEEMAAIHSDVVPGLIETIAALRARGLKIGATTGYPPTVSAVVRQVAAAQGFAPDVTIGAGDTPSGRPSPSMALKCVIDLDVSPVAACVKVGDTVVDIEEGLNAGMWSVGVSDTGNAAGLPHAEWMALPADERARRSSAAAEPLWRAGAHYVVPSVNELPPILDAIERRLAAGERP